MSNLSDIENIVSKHKSIWKIITWYFILAEVFWGMPLRINFLIKVIFTPSSNYFFIIFLYLFVWIISLLEIVALFAFSYEKKILTPLFWEILFYIAIIMTPLYIVSRFFLNHDTTELILNFLVVIPILLACFLYAFRYLPSRIAESKHS